MIITKNLIEKCKQDLKQKSFEQKSPISIVNKPINNRHFFFKDFMTGKQL